MAEYVTAPTVQAFPDAEALAWQAAEWLCRRAEAEKGRFAVALSGGSTPKRLYEALASPGIAARLPWERVHWFWGDERFVPPDARESNYAMTRAAMLSRVSAPAANIHPVPTVGLTPQGAAEAYERELRSYRGGSALNEGVPLFDVVLLGLGEDGHTASLFPGSAALEERHAWTAAVIGARPEPRITLTYPALESARDVVFLVAGATKRAMLAAVLAGEDYPAARVKPQGRLTWMVDRAALGATDTK